LEAERGLGRPTLSGRMLLLPLMGDGGRCDLAMGCVALEGGIGRTPRRFHIAHVLTDTLAVTAAREFAEPAVAFSGPRMVPHLRLVKSD
jgi:hypothetical protein